MEEFRKSLQTEMFPNKDHSSRPDNRKRPEPLPADHFQNEKQDKNLVNAESDGEEIKPENYFFTQNL